ncbi:hypothetical protein HG530_004226 [Fusarium avenaceum]|nr:hypothetical protein HG530_004226 [Fusarium avenaceum]
MIEDNGAVCAWQTFARILFVSCLSVIGSLALIEALQLKTYNIVDLNTKNAAGFVGVALLLAFLVHSLTEFVLARLSSLLLELIHGADLGIVSLLLELALLNPGLRKVANAPFQLSRHAITRLQSSEAILSLRHLPIRLVIFHQFLDWDFDSSKIVICADGDVAIGTTIFDKWNASVAHLELVAAFDVNHQHTHRIGVLLEIISSKHILQIESETLWCDILSHGCVDGRLNKVADKRHIHDVDGMLTQSSLLEGLGRRSSPVGECDLKIDKVSFFGLHAILQVFTAIAVLAVLLFGIILTLLPWKPSYTENTERLASLADILHTDHTNKPRERGLHHILQGVCKTGKQIGVDKRPNGADQGVEPYGCLGLVLFGCLHDASSMGIPHLVFKYVIDLVGHPFSNEFNKKPDSAGAGCGQYQPESAAHKP